MCSAWVTPALWLWYSFCLMPCDRGRVRQQLLAKAALASGCIFRDVGWDTLKRQGGEEYYHITKLGVRNSAFHFIQTPWVGAREGRKANMVLPSHLMAGSQLLAGDVSFQGLESLLAAWLSFREGKTISYSEKREYVRWGWYTNPRHSLGG